MTDGRKSESILIGGLFIYPRWWSPYLCLINTHLILGSIDSLPTFFWVKQGSLKRTWVPKWLFYHIFPSHGAMFLDSINLMFKVNRTWVVCVISIGHLFFFGGVSNVDANVVVVVFFFITDFPWIYIYSALFGFGVIFHDPDLCWRVW